MSSEMEENVAWDTNATLRNKNSKYDKNSGCEDDG